MTIALWVERLSPSAASRQSQVRSTTVNRVRDGKILKELAREKVLSKERSPESALALRARKTP